MTESTVLPPSRHLSWHELNQRISLGVPFVHRVPSPTPGAQPVDIDVNENGEQLSMWLPCEPSAVISVVPLKDVEIAAKKKAGRYGIEVSTRAQPLFQETYNFFVSTIDKVHLAGASAEVAVEETLAKWRELLELQSIMSEEAQLGLFGELWLLKRLACQFGEAAFIAWTGPHRQPHDFRIGKVEFEVKTTRGATHSHFINGLNQLEPSDGRSLYLLSIRLELAGAASGTTLPDEIAAVAAALPALERPRFNRLLSKVYGYDSAHDAMYRTRLQLAAPPRLIPVMSGCPRLTRPMLSGIPLLDRIGEVRYRANFEGLGYPEGSEEFAKIFSIPSISN